MRSRRRAETDQHDTVVAPAGGVLVRIGGETITGGQDEPIVVGRAERAGVIGLDATDMGISAVAASIAFTWSVWWLINESTKRPIFVEANPSRLQIEPGQRYALMADRVTVLVPGVIYTHMLEVTLPEEYCRTLRNNPSRATTGTLTASGGSLTDRERTALTAMFAGYLLPFPRRREHPNTYDDAARILGDDWTASKVRKTVERVKTRYDAKHGLCFEGAHANYDLAAHLIGNGIITGVDLRRIPSPGR